MVALPWTDISGLTAILDSEKARVSLNNLTHQLNKNPELELRYSKSILEMEANDVITEVLPDKGCVP